MYGSLGTVRYECNVLNGTGKKGNLKCDADGYYDVILGGFDVRNTRGDLWGFQSARPFFEQSSGFMKRINGGMLYGEWGHPSKLPGQTDRDFINRVLNVQESNVSHHIKSVQVDENSSFQGENGKPAVVIYGRVKPFGPHAQCVADSLENNAQNTSFSVRTLTRDVRDALGRATKTVISMVTWDAVLVPGIAFSNKFAHPSLESDSMEFDGTEVVAAYDQFKQTPGSMESGFLGEQFQTVIRELHRTAPDSKTGLILPASAYW